MPQSIAPSQQQYITNEMLFGTEGPSDLSPKKRTKSLNPNLVKAQNLNKVRQEIAMMQGSPEGYPVQEPRIYQIN